MIKGKLSAIYPKEMIKEKSAIYPKEMSKIRLSTFFQKEISKVELYSLQKYQLQKNKPISISSFQYSKLNFQTKPQTTLPTYLSISQSQTTILTYLSLSQSQATRLTSLSSPQYPYLTPSPPSSNSTTSIPSPPSSNSTTPTPSSKHSHQPLSAFSLIELSIVIIVLGLLTVGVMGGAGMVKTARVNNILLEYKKIKTGINSFLLYRNRLPGDTNRDDLIENEVIANGASISESLYFWKELLEEDLIGDLRYNPSDNLTNNIIVGTTIPSSRYDKNIGWHMMYLNDEKTNVLVLSGFDNGKMVDAKASHTVDIKMDDGNPLDGKVYIGNNNDEHNCVVGEEYSEGNNEEQCVIIFSDNVVSNVVNIERGIEELASSGVEVFNYTGSSQRFVVPVGVKEIKIEVWGASASVTSWGGRGGYTHGNYTMSDTRTLYIYVGKKGTDSNGGKNFNGGKGYAGDATDVRISSNSLTCDSSTDPRLIVAGGSGCCGSNPCYGGGGNNPGGGGNGDVENLLLDGSPVGSGFPQGGKLSSGGAGINTGDSSKVSWGTCGNGGFGKDYVGGGSGWYGGGGGKEGTGSGGGSGYCNTSKLSGCNGSSGVRYGDGVARICWGDRIGECNGNQTGI
jgi:hypothetical protein